MPLEPAPKPALDQASAIRPSIPVSSDTELFGIARSLGISLQLEPFPYKLDTDINQLILQAKKDNGAEDLEAPAMDAAQRATPDYLKSNGQITPKAFLDEDVLGIVLRLYRDQQLTEEQCLAFLAERSLFSCAGSVVRTQRFIDDLELTEEAAASDSTVMMDKELIEFSLKTYQVYVQLSKKLKEKPDLRESIGQGLLEEEKKVLAVK